MQPHLETNHSRVYEESMRIEFIRTEIFSTFRD